jgi:hypothetical protein
MVVSWATWEILAAVRSRFNKAMATSCDPPMMAAAVDVFSSALIDLRLAEYLANVVGLAIGGSFTAISGVLGISLGFSALFWCTVKSSLVVTVSYFPAC